ncbi:hypothetical protein [Erythrobacter mangrovi]|uniref:hypothetical protein n=1 Tax=Erythrobacter mangrovi TaxID=2739433 RepID=UPI001F3E2765|nr:hypothetical protein [Erythrobacter mangrovi]
MATAKTRSSNLRRRLWLLVLLFAALAAVWAAWGEGVRRNAAAATAYGAHVTCSCRYIEGRSLEDCAKDKLDGMEFVRFSEDPEAKSITAMVPFVASDTATWRDGYGCVLKEWES